jgi:hypothetical protein
MILVSGRICEMSSSIGTRFFTSMYMLASVYSSPHIDMSVTVILL